MKKLCFLLILALLLSLGASAFADNSVEILYMDGTPVAVESPALTAGETAAFHAPGAGLTLPAALVAIEEEAFEGIDAARVEITENVVSIGPRAFADCKNLTELVIPATVQTIDDTALEGSENVTIYGEADSEAQRFADANSIPFVPSNEVSPIIIAQPPVTLPYVALS